MPPKKPPRQPAEETFPAALAKLLRSRKLSVPRGLKDAPPEAYAGQPSSVVEQMAGLPDAELVRRAEKVAGYAKAYAERVRRAWDGSPLIAELRRRGLPEPAVPKKVIGAAFSLKRPLAEWTDKELMAAAKEWSRRAT